MKTKKKRRILKHVRGWKDKDKMKEINEKNKMEEIRKQDEKNIMKKTEKQIKCIVLRNNEKKQNWWPREKYQHKTTKIKREMIEWNLKSENKKEQPWIINKNDKARSKTNKSILSPFLHCLHTKTIPQDKSFFFSQKTSMEG